METTYFFRDTVRWSWPFESPNHLGAAIVMLFPLLWSSELCFRRSIFQYGAIIGEILLTVGLCKTYSRGSLAGLFVAVVVFLAFATRLPVENRLLNSRIWLRRLWPRVLLFCLIFLATDFHERTDPTYVSRDRAVTNRFAIWGGALDMISSAPLKGWGFYDTVEKHRQWFLPVELELSYGNLVSGNLQFAVQYGLVAFSAAAGFLIYLCLTPLRLASSVDPPAPTYALCLSIAGSSSLAGLFAANSFSTLALSPGLCFFATLVMAIQAGILVSSGWRKPVGYRPATYSVVISLALASGLWLASHLLRGTRPLVIRTIDRWTMSVQRAERTAKTQLVHVVPDSKVLGPNYGHELRRLALASPPGINFIIHERVLAARPVFDGNPVILIGRSANILSGKVSERIALIHPILNNKLTATASPEVLVRPSVDELGQNAFWDTHLETSRNTAVTASQGGLDIRRAWQSVGPNVVTRLTDEP